jgi:hypothetical protein
LASPEFTSPGNLRKNPDFPTHRIGGEDRSPRINGKMNVDAIGIEVLRADDGEKLSARGIHLHTGHHFFGRDDFTGRGHGQVYGIAASHEILGIRHAELAEEAKGRAVESPRGDLVPASVGGEDHPFGIHIEIQTLVREDEFAGLAPVADDADLPARDIQTADDSSGRVAGEQFLPVEFDGGNVRRLSRLAQLEATLRMAFRIVDLDAISGSHRDDPTRPNGQACSIFNHLPMRGGYAARTEDPDLVVPQGVNTGACADRDPGKRATEAMRCRLT